MAPSQITSKAEIFIGQHGFQHNWHWHHSEWAKKVNHFEKSVTRVRCMMTEKGDSYIKMFSTLSGERMLSWNFITVKYASH